MRLFPSLHHRKEGWPSDQENIAKPPLFARTGWFSETAPAEWKETHEFVPHQPLEGSSVERVHSGASRCRGLSYDAMVGSAAAHIQVRAVGLCHRTRRSSYRWNS